jgi:hypothetical protein
MNSPSFNLNTLKGRMAEHLIQDLFIQSGYNVFNFGLERLMPSLSKMLAFNNQKTSKDLRFMPDFVVQSTENGDLFYLEVKFRADGFFSFDERYKDYPYQNAWFVIVSPEKIQCMHFKRLKAGYGIHPDSKYVLNKVKSFHIDAAVLAEYEEYAKQIFASFRKG